MVNQNDDLLTFTVGTVWREERVSCPHPDVLRSYAAASLPAGAMGFLRFHLEECQCPYCNAVLTEIREEKTAATGELRDMQDRLMRSTVTALRKHRS